MIRPITYAVAKLRPAGFAAVVNLRGMVESMSDVRPVARRHRVLIMTADALKATLAGPGIRAWNIAKTLAQHHSVKLVTTSECDLKASDFEVLAVGESRVSDLVAWSEIILVQGNILYKYPAIVASDRIVVVDLYDPFHLEQLEHSKEVATQDRLRILCEATAVVDDSCLRGDFFICASEKQRSFWLGHLAALGRLNVVSYDPDPTLRSLVAVVPFGIPEEPPRLSRRMLKGVHPGIAEDDIVILWAGGVYNWFDPLTLIRAVAKLRMNFDNVRLFFLGMHHPHPDVGEMQMARKAQQLAGELDLVGKHVFFNNSWVEYAERSNYLLDADIGVSCHPDTLEAAFSFRTRMLDYLWAGLPMVATRGDFFAELIDRHQLGRTVEPGDVDGLVAALAELIGEPKLRAQCRERVLALAPTYRWSNVLKPLLEFCASPGRAPDLCHPWTARRIGYARAVVHRTVHGWRYDLGLVVEHYQTGGLRRVVAKMAARFGRRLLSVLVRVFARRRPSRARR